MAPVYQTTPRKDGKTQAEADEAMAEHLNTYYIQEEEREESTIESSAPPPVPAKRKAKRPVREAQEQSSKSKSNSSSEPKSDEVQSSPATRKSARVAAKRRAASDPVLSDADAEGAQPPPMKRQKLSPTSEIRRDQVLNSIEVGPAGSFRQLLSAKRSASESSVSDEDHEKQPASKKSKLSPLDDTTTSSSKTPSSSSNKKTNPRATPVDKDIAGESSTPDSVDDDEHVETEPDDGDEDEDENVGTGRKRNGKKPAAKAFQGTKSGFGTSIEAPEDATQQQPWKCANRDCNSGQTYHKRDGPQSYGRKVISNFFGRNKRETNLINLEVWHNYCRKCYQRGTYRVNNISALEKVKFYVNNIEMQLDRIELWRPNATFTVQLSKGATARLGRYYRELNKQGATEASAKAAVTKAPQTNSKGKDKPLPLEDGFPADLLAHFEDNYVGTDQSFLDIKLILNWVTNLAENGEIDCMPPMEFLISKQADDEEGVVDPALNYDRWCAHEDGIEYEDEDAREEDDDAGEDDAADEGNDSNSDHRGEDAEPPNRDHDHSGYDGDEDDATDEAEDTDHDGKQGDSQHHHHHDTNADNQSEESSEESDEEVKEAINFTSDEFLRGLMKKAIDPSARTLSRDFYEDHEQTDEDEEYEAPTTPYPPRRKFQLTPTGRGGPILPNQASTYHVNRDGPSVDFSHKRKRSYQQEAIDARQQMPADPRQVEAARALMSLCSGPREYTSTDPSSNASATNATLEPAMSKRQIDENYNDTSSEGGEESPSKKRKL